MANLFIRTYTFVDGTTAYGSQVEAEVGNIVNVLNNLNTAVSTWGQVSISNAVGVPLVADCASGSQHIADFKNNSVIKASISSAGSLTATGGTLSGALAMGSNKITGLASGTASGEAIHFGQYQFRAQNIVDNGGFEIWQRGNTFSSVANASYTSDRWQISTTEIATVVVTKETTTIDAVGLASMKVVTTGSGASKIWYVYNTIENYADYRGKTVSFSVRVNSNTASAIKIGIADSSTTTLSSYHTGGSAFETLTVTATIGAAITQLYVLIGMISAGDKRNGTFYWDSAMLSLGSEALDFVPTVPQADLSRCQRFYQRFGSRSGTEYIASGQCTSTTAAQSIVQLPVLMRTSPTVTVVAPTTFNVTNASGGVIAATAVTANTPLPQSVLMLVTVASGLVAGNVTELLANNIGSYIEVSADF